LPNIFIQLWNASLKVFNPRFRMADTVVATEVIEHLDDDELHSFSTVVFSAYHPTVVVLTTPNYDFNKYFDSPVNDEECRTTRFKDPTGRTDRIFRQADHHFEWTMDEFQVWCNHIAATYGYNVEFSGVGPFWSYPTRQDYTNGPDLKIRPPEESGAILCLSDFYLLSSGSIGCRAHFRLVDAHPQIILFVFIS